MKTLSEIIQSKNGELSGRYVDFFFYFLMLVFQREIFNQLLTKIAEKKAAVKIAAAF